MSDEIMFDLGEAGYPELSISRQALPFVNADVGDTFKLVATVKLNNVAQEGNTYQFQVRAVAFPGRGPDVSTVKGRVTDRRSKEMEGS
jgi:hypothetical protein